MTPTRDDVIAILSGSKVPMSSTEVLDAWANATRTSLDEAREYAGKLRALLRSMFDGDEVIGACRRDDTDGEYAFLIPPWADARKETWWWLHPDHRDEWESTLRWNSARWDIALEMRQALLRLFAEARAAAGPATGPATGPAVTCRMHQRPRDGETVLDLTLRDHHLAELLTYLDRMPPSAQ